MVDMVEVEVPEKGGIDSVDGFANSQKTSPDHHVIVPRLSDVT